MRFTTKIPCNLWVFSSVKQIKSHLLSLNFLQQLPAVSKITTIWKVDIIYVYFFNLTHLWFFVDSAMTWCMNSLPVESVAIANVDFVMDRKFSWPLLRRLYIKKNHTLFWRPHGVLILNGTLLSFNFSRSLSDITGLWSTLPCPLHLSCLIFD